MNYYYKSTTQGYIFNYLLYVCCITCRPCHLLPVPSLACTVSHTAHHLCCLLHHPLPTLSVVPLLSGLCVAPLIAHAMRRATHPPCRVTLPVAWAVCHTAHHLCHVSRCNALTGVKARRWRVGDF